MDIHAHHLHKAPGQRFWHYFFEFLMLFLAVTLGFFVENQREKYVEEHRAKEYAQSLYDDLKIDTSVIQRTLGEKVWIQAKYDSALKILDTSDLSRYNEFMYYMGTYLTFNDAFTSQDVTYQQLRSSGSFRYIKNIALYKKIADYYNLYSRYQLIDRFGHLAENDVVELELKIFNPKDFFNVGYTGGTFYDVERPKEKLHPISVDEQSLRLLYGKFATARNRAGGCVLLLGWLKTMATDAMNDLKKEYQLE
jgi:hypothetical protein